MKGSVNALRTISLYTSSILRNTEIKEIYCVEMLQILEGVGGERDDNTHKSVYLCFSPVILCFTFLQVFSISMT